MDPKTNREKLQVPQHTRVTPAHTLEEAANSDDTLQGYAAINNVDEHSAIAKEAAKETGSGDRDEIAQLAYQYHLERGGEHGAHEDDWYRAEETIRARKAKVKTR